MLLVICTGAEGVGLPTPEKVWKWFRAAQGEAAASGRNRCWSNWRRLDAALQEYCDALTETGNSDKINTQDGRVSFERYQAEKDGTTYEMIAPKFERFYTVQQLEELYTAKNRRQFRECNIQTYQATLVDPKLRNMFDETQLYDMSKGVTPSGYVWHHDVITGEMQLVDFEIHRKTGHTGGYAIWGKPTK